MGNNFSVESTFLPFLCGKQNFIYNLEDNLEDLYKVIQELNAKRNDLMTKVSNEEDIHVREVKRWISMTEEIEPKVNCLLDGQEVKRWISRVEEIESTVNGLLYLQEVKRWISRAKEIEPTVNGLLDRQEVKRWISRAKEIEPTVNGLLDLQEVKSWISRAEKIEPTVNGLIDKSVFEIQRLSNYGYCSSIPASTYRYAETVLMNLQNVKTLISEGVFEVGFNRAIALKRPQIQLTVSQQKNFERACNLLEDKNVGTVCLYGKGGVGKTTILTKIKKKFQEAFDIVIYVVVVASAEVDCIQEKLCIRLDIPRFMETNEMGRAAKLTRALEEKRFLLLLDGIQGEVDLKKIGVPYPSQENGCKIAFTTISRIARCERTWLDAQVELTCLNTEEAWDLFQEIVGEKTLTSHQGIPELARIVASTCHGLPLALNLIGETMSRKKTVREWRYTINHWASSAAEFPDMEDTALPILKSIYNNMSDENIRLCFLSCTLFPENCDIRKEDLVNYWICEGILAKEDREKAEIEGYKIIYDLIQMRLLMEDGSGCYVKMHGIIRELALWIESGFGRKIDDVFVVGGERIHQLPMVNDWGMVRRMSVTYTEIRNISNSFKCSQLTTLVLRRNRHLQWISGAFFRWMTGLLVLDLSFNKALDMLPEEISSLVLLRFLDLSRTGIKRLPLGLKELTSLIHLDLDYTSNLQEVDVIASLLNLQVLRLFHSVPMDLKLMEDIQLLKSLKELSLTVMDYSLLQRLLSIRLLASSIRSLSFNQTTIAGGEILSLDDMFGLQELDIFACNIPEITIDWRSTIQRETIHLGHIKKVSQFQNIRTVTIYRCECLRELTWLVLAQSISELKIAECPLVEEVISKEKAMAEMGDTSEQPFQNLRKLVLVYLPKLESIYWTPLRFPVLEYIEIIGCPELKRVPFDSESSIGNQFEMKIQEEWIKVVEWEDDATKQRFSHFSNRRGVPRTFPIVGMDTDQMAFEGGIDGDLVTKSWMASKKAYQSEHYIIEEVGGIVYFAFRPSFSVKNLFAIANTSSFGDTKMKGVEFPCMGFIGTDKDATVNEAFLENLQVIIGHTTSFQASVKRAVERGVQQIVFTGHSSGGATAILATVWYLETYFIRNSIVPEPRCVTFGAPLVGDYIFKHALGRENWSRFFLNFVTKFDIVPRIMLAQKASIEKTLPYVLVHLDPTTGASVQEGDQKIRKFFSTVLRDTSTVAYKAVCHLIGDAEALLTTVDSFLQLSPYTPLGTFVFSTEKRLVAVDNTAAILQMLYYTYPSRDDQEWSQTPSRSIKDHHGYEDMVHSIWIKLFTRLDLYNSPLYGENSIGFALNDLGVGTRGRECVHAIFEAEKRRIEFQKKFEKNKDKIEKMMKEAQTKWIVEEYKPKCQDQRNGYYDSSKVSNEEKDFQANEKRAELAGYFDEVLRLVKKGQLPDEFEGSRDWISLATRYRILFEPLDISNYHRHLKNKDTGPYMGTGRPTCYKHAQRVYEHERLKPTGKIADDVFWRKVNDLNLGLQQEMQEILKKPGSECGSCFWAEVEELKGKAYEEVEVRLRVKTLEGLLDGWIIEGEVDANEIFLEGSTFRKWWNTLPDNHKLHSPLREHLIL